MTLENGARANLFIRTMRNVVGFDVLASHILARRNLSNLFIDLRYAPDPLLLTAFYATLNTDLVDGRWSDTPDLIPDMETMLRIYYHQNTDRKTPMRRERFVTPYGVRSSVYYDRNKKDEGELFLSPSISIPNTEDIPFIAPRIELTDNEDDVATFRPPYPRGGAFDRETAYRDALASVGAALWVVCMTAKMDALTLYGPLTILSMVVGRWRFPSLNVDTNEIEMAWSSRLLPNQVRSLFMWPYAGRYARRAHMKIADEVDKSFVDDVEGHQYDYDRNVEIDFFSYLPNLFLEQFGRTITALEVPVYEGEGRTEPLHTEDVLQRVFHGPSIRAGHSYKVTRTLLRLKRVPLDAPAMVLECFHAGASPSREVASLWHGRHFSSSWMNSHRRKWR